MLLATAAAFAAPGQTDPLTPAPTRDRKVVRRWQLPGDPRGVALGADGTIYAGLAEPQAVVAVDPKSGAVTNRVVLDSPDIASTKELVTLRTNADRSRLYIANGSDESATILELPGLGILREITMEGETVRDLVPDPRGRYLYLLGRRVHVFDAEGDVELRTLDVDDPMALAVSSDGASLAVIAPHDFGNARATVAVLFDTKNFAEASRDPLQTEKQIEAAMFANGDQSLLAFSRDSLFDKFVHAKPATVKGASAAGAMRVDIGDLVNSSQLCLPEGSGPQIATLAGTDRLLVYAERRCSASGSFDSPGRRVMPASIYGISAYALAYDESSNTIVATDRAGFLTIYKVPRPAIVR